MIKSKIESNTVELGFPKLMIKENANLIVLFSSPEAGVALTSSVSVSAGNYSDSWNAEAFIDFKGSINLRNEGASNG